MKNFRKIASFNWLLLLFLSLSLSVVATSCGDDDDKKKDEPAASVGSTKLVGQWHFYDDVNIDYRETFVFRSDGTGSYNYYDDPSNSDTFTYTYNESTSVLTLNFKSWDKETCYVRWLNQNMIDIEYYGTFIRN